MFTNLPIFILKGDAEDQSAFMNSLIDGLDCVRLVPGDGLLVFWEAVLESFENKSADYAIGYLAAAARYNRYSPIIVTGSSLEEGMKERIESETERDAVFIDVKKGEDHDLNAFSYASDITYTARKKYKNVKWFPCEDWKILFPKDAADSELAFMDTLPPDFFNP